MLLIPDIGLYLTFMSRNKQSQKYFSGCPWLVVLIRTVQFGDSITA